MSRTNRGNPKEVCFQVQLRANLYRSGVELMLEISQSEIIKMANQGTLQKEYG